MGILDRFIEVAYLVVLFVGPAYYLLQPVANPIPPVAHPTPLSANPTPPVANPIPPVAHPTPPVANRRQSFTYRRQPAANPTRPVANRMASVTGDEYCRALTNDEASRCNSNDLCTYGNAMTPKYSCSRSTIDESTSIYQQNPVNLRHNTDIAPFFPKQYIDFLKHSREIDGRAVYLYAASTRYEFEPVRAILNIFLYIPGIMGRIKVPKYEREGLYEEWLVREEFEKNIKTFEDPAYECIALLGIIGVPDDLIRYTLEENLMMGLIKLYKYTILPQYIELSIEESLNFFALIRDSTNKD